MVGEARVHLFEAGADAERSSELAQMMRAELLELDVQDVSPLAEGPPPTGARALDAAAVGSLLVAMGHSVNALRSLTASLMSWLSRGSADRSVRIEIDGDVLEITRTSKAHEARLVDVFIQRHSPEVGGAWTASEEP